MSAAMQQGLADAAIALGLPVFPCNADKKPCTKRGFHDAVRDPAAVRHLFRHPATALIGVPTGAASGLAVVDVDTRDGGAGLAWLAANEHRIPRTRRHRTRSGGLHLVFRRPADAVIRNSQGRATADGEVKGISPGVDVRGEGGYVCAPPSPPTCRRG